MSTALPPVATSSSRSVAMAAASTSTNTSDIPRALAWRARPAPIPAPAPVMTATPPPKVSRASTAQAFAGAFSAPGSPAPESGSELVASSITDILVNWGPFGPRRTPISTTPLDTANGTNSVIWLTKM